MDRIVEGKLIAKDAELLIDRPGKGEAGDAGLGEETKAGLRRRRRDGHGLFDHLGVSVMLIQEVVPHFVGWGPRAAGLEKASKRQERQDGCHTDAGRSRASGSARSHVSRK